MEGDGAHALFMAAQNGHIEVVQLLLDQPGINLDQGRLYDGNTAVHIATESNHIAIVKLLLAHGADPNKARTSDGRSKTPLSNQ